MRPTRHGFTLIEMVIALGLGLVLIYTVFAGFRVASQSMSIATRLSTENSLLRAGFMSALDEVDFWTAYDDPINPARQTLRANGLQFCRMSAVFPPSGVVAGTAPVFPAPETDRGWDSAYEWPACDPRTWWMGNMAERYDTDLRMGDYSLIASMGGSAPHSWLYSQMDGLKRALGYQGFCEYLPANLPYGYSSTSGGGTNPGKMLMEFIRPVGDGTVNGFHNGDGDTHFVQGRYRNTKNTSYGIYPLAPLAGTVNYQNESRQFVTTGVGSNPGTVTTFMNKVTALNNPLDPRLKPDAWPSISVNVARYMTYNRFVCLNKVRWISALTGEVIELSFSAFGTTLRGARQQRRPDVAQWAQWYGTGDARNTINLDSP